MYLKKKKKKEDLEKVLVPQSIQSLVPAPSKSPAT